MTTSVRTRRVSVLSHVVDWVLILMTASLPLFFLTMTSLPLEGNKQMLFIILSLVAIVCWFGELLLRKRVATLGKTVLILSGGYFIALFVSSLLSLAGYQTWIGQVAQQYTSFLSLTFFLLFFLLIAHHVRDVVVQARLLFALIVSATVAGVLFYMDVFWGVAPILTEGVVFNSVGTMNAFAVFLLVVSFVGMLLWLVEGEREGLMLQGWMGRCQHLCIALLSLMSLTLLVAMDFWPLWIVSIVSLSLMGGLFFLKTGAFPRRKRLFLPLLFLLASVALMFLPSPLSLNLPVVVSPSYITSWEISQDVLQSSTPRLLFGSGPATFVHDYLRFKPLSVNESLFWSLRFDRAQSAFLTQLATTGVVSVLLWIALQIVVGVSAIRRLLQEKDVSRWGMMFVAFGFWLVLLLQHLLFSSNMTLSYLLWLATGLLAAVVFELKERLTLSEKSIWRLGVSTGLVVIFVALFTSAFVAGSGFMADVAFARAGEVDDSPSGTLEEIVGSLEDAVDYNPFSDTYQRNLSAAYLLQAKTLLSGAGEELSAEELRVLTDYVSQAIDAAALATSLEPNFVSNWVVRGSIYRDVMPYANGAEDLAAQAFLNAISLEPAHPGHRTDLGRVYLLVAQRAEALSGAEDEELAADAVAQEASLLATAEEVFLAAIEQKSDYLPAHYYLAATYERQGKLDQAAERFVALTQANPTDIGMAFQLSQLLIRLGEFEAANVELERIVSLSPNYSNALWYLAGVKDVLGDREAAIELMQQIVTLNPDNVAATQRLADLLEGESTEVLSEPLEGEGVE